MRRKISVITGGSGGMGKAIANELGKYTTVLLADCNLRRLKEAKYELENLGHEIHIFEFDVSIETQVKKLVEYAESLGDIINVIHTAGVSPTDSDTTKILSVNAMGTLYIVNNFYKIIHEGGTLISFASMAAYTMTVEEEWYKVFDGYDSISFFSDLIALTEPYKDDEFFRSGVAYCISKRFVIYYTQKNVLRYAKKGNRILSISPGPYMTPMHQKLIENQPDIAEGQLELVPCGRWGKPYEIASLTAFICTTSAGFISGIDILADAGQISNTFIEQIV